MKFHSTQPQATPKTKYATLGRSSLLSVILFSIINMISLPLTNTYFLFSSYFPFYCTLIGIDLQSTAMLLLFSALGLVLLAPYILCYVFSARHVGWMIGATVLFLFESLFAVGDALLLLAIGETSMLADGLFHIFISVMLIMASVNGVRRKRAGLPLVSMTDAEFETANTPAAPIADVAAQDDVPDVDTVGMQQEEISTPAHSDAVEQERAQQDNRWE